MRQRTPGTGTSATEVSALRLGRMGMSDGLGPAKDQQEMSTLLRGAVERGVTLTGTAEAYAPYANAELVGEARAPYRGQVVIATTFGFKFGRYGEQVGMDSRPEHSKHVAEDSLKRLQLKPSLPWPLVRKPWIVPIPGATKLKRLEENLAATSVQLAPDDLREIERTASRITVRRDSVLSIGAPRDRPTQGERDADNQELPQHQPWAERVVHGHGLY